MLSLHMILFSDRKILYNPIIFLLISTFFTYVLKDTSLKVCLEQTSNRCEDTVEEDCQFYGQMVWIQEVTQQSKK